MSVNGEVIEAPIKALMNAVSAYLATVGDTTPHVYGIGEKFANSAPPRYVWIPDSSDLAKVPSTRGPEDYRELFLTEDVFFVRCWGQSADVAHGLRWNLQHALKAVAGADYHPRKGGWFRPSESANQLGEIFVVAGALLVPQPDSYVDISTLFNEPPPFATIEEVDGTLQITPDLDTDDAALEVQVVATLP